VGGLPEVIEHGVSGFLALVGDVGAMTEATLRVLEAPASEREARRLAARARAESRFRLEPMVDLYEAYYRRVISSSSSPRAPS
jgi:glycosyltransferase involved in cell wall biosynthesis